MLNKSSISLAACFCMLSTGIPRSSHNSLNALPDHVFAAQRGFYVGWMDTSGNWLYCQSIFSSAAADDVPSYGY